MWKTGLAQEACARFHTSTRTHKYLHLSIHMPMRIYVRMFAQEVQVLLELLMSAKVQAHDLDAVSVSIFSITTSSSGNQSRNGNNSRCPGSWFSFLFIVSNMCFATLSRPCCKTHVANNGEQ